jgi:hypothetical protein
MFTIFIKLENFQTFYLLISTISPSLGSPIAWEFFSLEVVSQLLAVSLV